MIIALLAAVIAVTTADESTTTSTFEPQAALQAGEGSSKNCNELGWTFSATQQIVCGASEIEGLCYNDSHTYAEATAVCEAVGARLCTVDEVVRHGASIGTGCGLDLRQVWTNDTCNGTFATTDGVTTGVGLYTVSRNGQPQCTRGSAYIGIGIRCCANAMADFNAISSTFHCNPDNLTQRSSKYALWGGGNTLEECFDECRLHDDCLFATFTIRGACKMYQSCEERVEHSKDMVLYEKSFKTFSPTVSAPTKAPTSQEPTGVPTITPTTAPTIECVDSVRGWCHPETKPCCSDAGLECSRRAPGDSLYQNGNNWLCLIPDPDAACVERNGSCSSNRQCCSGRCISSAGWTCGDSLAPTPAPTGSPVTIAPSHIPTFSSPTSSPTTISPTKSPFTSYPTRAPTSPQPSGVPTLSTPTKIPSVSPTASPASSIPTAIPTATPTKIPTLSPTIECITEVRENCHPVRKPCCGALECYEKFGAIARISHTDEMENYHCLYPDPDQNRCYQTGQNCSANRQCCTQNCDPNSWSCSSTYSPTPAPTQTPTTPAPTYPPTCSELMRLNLVDTLPQYVCESAKDIGGCLGDPRWLSTCALTCSGCSALTKAPSKSSNAPTESPVTTSTETTTLAAVSTNSEEEVSKFMSTETFIVVSIGLAVIAVVAIGFIYWKTKLSAASSQHIASFRPSKSNHFVSRSALEAASVLANARKRKEDTRFGQFGATGIHKGSSTVKHSSKDSHCSQSTSRKYGTDTILEDGKLYRLNSKTSFASFPFDRVNVSKKGEVRAFEQRQDTDVSYEFDMTGTLINKMEVEPSVRSVRTTKARPVQEKISKVATARPRELRPSAFSSKELQEASGHSEGVIGPSNLMDQYLECSDQANDMKSRKFPPTIKWVDVEEGKSINGNKTSSKYEEQQMSPNIGPSSTGLLQGDTYTDTSSSIGDDALESNHDE